MKVLVIHGSPRAKGNSDLLCDEFIRGAEKAGHQVEKISLLDRAEGADVLVLALPIFSP